VIYEWMGRTHAAIAQRLGDERGQGTVEYVGVVLLVAVLVGAITAAAGKNGSGIAGELTKKIQEAIKQLDVGGK
jgi:hypothetical protein